jgi:hypothetical protein
MRPRSMRLTLQIVAWTLACGVAVSSVAREPMGTSTSPKADARQRLLELEDEWVTAEEKHDEAALRRILDDKFVATFGTDKTADKESFIREILATGVDPTHSQTLNHEVVIIDGDTAVLVSTDTERGTRHGVAYTAVARFTTTYIQRHGRWLALAEQAVMLPPAK